MLFAGIRQCKLVSTYELPLFNIFTKCLHKSLHKDFCDNSANSVNCATENILIKECSNSSQRNRNVSAQPHTTALKVFDYFKTAGNFICVEFWACVHTNLLQKGDSYPDVGRSVWPSVRVYQTKAGDLTSTARTILRAVGPGQRQPLSLSATSHTGPGQSVFSFNITETVF